jgi:2-desacetyl-2-hydroxyethyl bacteriochlorophyllide A dehydrogenase
LKRRAVYFSAPLAAELIVEEYSPPAANEVLVETLISAISPGTEMLVYRGQAPEEMAVDETISALGGSFRFPIKFGYSAVGRIVATGPGVADEWLGRLVFAFNPHETQFVAPLPSVIPLPDGITPEAAVFLPNMETAVSFVMDGRPAIGEQIVIIGQGIVGLLTTALLADFPAASLVTIDPITLRRERSIELGATASLPPAELAEASLAIQTSSPRAGADLAYELSGNPQGLDMAIALTGAYGRVVIGSWYGRKRAELDLGGRFHRAHMTLLGSQVSAIAPEWLGRWTKERRLDVAWRMLLRHRPERLITHRMAIDHAPDAYRLLDEQPEEVIQIVFDYT